MPDIDNGKRIIDQTTGTVAPDDAFIIDSLTNGTRKASYASVAEQVGNTLNISSISALASGAMQKTVYDADGDGVVDDAERLGNQLPAYYATKQSVDTLDAAVMKKSVYDTNSNGAADRADAVAWSGVENTPETLAGYGISSVPVTLLDGVIDSENLPDTDWSRIQNTPTTLSGYGITNAYTKTETDDAIEEVSGLFADWESNPASEAHEPGSYIIDSDTNDLYKVIASIDEDDELELDVNVKIITVGEELRHDEVESDAGNPIVIETDAAQYAKNTHLTLAPVQDLHGYDHPWPGGAGKNLCNANNFILSSGSGVTLSKSNEELTLNGTAGQSNVFFQNTVSLPRGNYKVSFVNSSNSNVRAALLNSDAQYYADVDLFTANKVITVTNNDILMIIIYVSSGKTVSDYKIKVQIEAGTTATSWAPYSNICPITGVDEIEVRATGKNLTPLPTLQGYWAGVDGAFVSSPNWVSVLKLSVGPNTTYTLSASRETRWTAVALYKADGTYLYTVSNQIYGSVSLTFTTPSNCHLIGITIADKGSSQGIVPSDVTDLQLELGSTATDYEPYQGYTASLDLPEEVYSGTLDLETGELVADKGLYVFDGSNDESWGQGSNADANVFYISITTNPIKPTSNKYKGVNAIHYSRLEVGEFAHSMDFNDNILGGDFNFRTTFTTLADFKNDLASNPLEVVAGLPSPIIYQLTPQQLALLKSTNVISTNAKTVQVTYRNGELATTGNIVESTEVAKKSIIGEAASDTDAKLAPILGSLATAETSPTIASHAVGEYLLYNNRLYKVLAAISAGQQLTIGTNVGQTNVAAELASQASMITVINSRMSDTAGFHNGIYRGKNITSYLTDGSLWDRIRGANGYALFDDIYLGDYITVGSNSYAIVDFDYYLRCGNADVTEHHVIMMPIGNMSISEGTALYGVSGQTLQFINTTNAGVTVTSQETATAFKWNAKMSDPNTHSTNGGYKYSRMRQVIMKAANTIVINAFGSSHVKPIAVLYPNPSSETASGIASGWAWFVNDDQSAADAKSLCDLPNETQIYGQQVWGRGTVYTNMGYEVGTDKFQFAICALQRNFVDTRAYWWLRSVYSASYAALVDYAGDAAYYGAAYAYGVRPRFVLVG